MSPRGWRTLDRLTLIAMAVGVALMLAPWSDGLRTGFAIASLATLAQIVVAHLPDAGE